MTEPVTPPAGSRPAARIVLLDEDDRVLLLQGREGKSGRKFWVTPGGGLQSHESFREAAIREAREEIGLEVSPGPSLWTRHHIFEWSGRTLNQFEVFFLARTRGPVAIDGTPDHYVEGHRWWSLAELETSDEIFAPRRIAALMQPVIRGEIPGAPFDCGV